MCVCVSAKGQQIPDGLKMIFQGMLQWWVMLLCPGWWVRACQGGSPGACRGRGHLTAELTVSVVRQQISLSPAFLCQHW